MYQLIEVDPRELAEYPGNVREVPGDLSGMVETMKERGVIVPLIVAHVGDGTGTFKVLAGKRRTQAAILAGLATVPALVTAGGSDNDEDDRIRSLIENVVRKDLTPVEEAEGWRQLQMSGLDEKAIARVAGVKVARVEHGLAVGASSVAVAVAKKHDLTLEQAVVLAEFDDDKEAVKALTVTAVKEPGRFPHVASRFRQDRERVRARAAAVADLEAKGVTVWDGPVGYGAGAYVERLSSLKDGKTSKKFTAANHRKCPGHAAVVEVDYQSKAQTTYVCTAATENGHKPVFGQLNRSTKPAEGSKEAEKAKAERRAVLAANKEWRAAEPVRREFVKELLARRSAPIGVMGYVTAEILGVPEDLAPMNRGKTDEMLTELTGVKPGTAEYSYSRKVGLAIVAKAKTGQLALALLAQVAAAREMGLDPQGARMHRRHDARYLTFLESQGYTLSDVEKDLVAKAGKK